MTYPILVQFRNLAEVEAAINAVAALRGGTNDLTADEPNLGDFILEALSMYPPMSASKETVLRTLLDSADGAWVPFATMVDAINGEVSQIGQRASDLAAGALRDLSFQMKEKVPAKYRAKVRTPIEVLANRSRVRGSIQYRLTPDGRAALQVFISQASRE